MRKLLTAGSPIAGLLAGAIVWFVLYVIIGVSLWVSFVVWGGVAIAGMGLGALATAHARSSSHDKARTRQSSGGPIGAR